METLRSKNTDTPGHVHRMKKPLIRAIALISGGKVLSGRRDSNPRPLDPQLRQRLPRTLIAAYVDWS
jgi:hypothetical protein